MQTENDPKEQPPEQPGQPTDCEQSKTKYREWHPMPLIKPTVERMPHEIGGVFTHDRSVRVQWVAEEYPKHMCPPSAVTRRMRITHLVGVLVMDAVDRRPEDRSTLKRHRATHCEEIFEPSRNLIGPMRMESVVAHADPPAATNPVKHHCDNDGIPRREEQCGDSKDVKNYHHRRRHPTELATIP